MPYDKSYYKKNKDKILKSQRNYYRKNKEKINERYRKRWPLYYERYKHKKSINDKKRREERRRLVLSHYSNGTLECACCKEKTYEFLTIDHINSCGRIARKKYGLGDIFYRWLIKNNYPDGFQVLCYNCNSAKGHYGYSPKCPNKQLSSNPKV